MRVVAALRGFPGLGRVIAGIELVSRLRLRHGAEIRLFTYLQGAAYAESLGFSASTPNDLHDISSIGVVPVSRFGETIIECCANWPADLIIVDGEPLLIQALRVSGLPCQTIALLNPFDVDNPFNPRSSQLFFNDCYSRSDIAVVHGLWEIAAPTAYRRFYSLPTILRSAVIDLEPSYSEDRVSCILGGGTVNANGSFLGTTSTIATTCIEAARILAKTKFDIYCGSESVVGCLAGIDLPKNIRLHKSLGSADEMYGTSKLVVTRAGRNTLSEVLYLGMPAIVFAASDPHRGSEQQTNLRTLRSLASNVVSDLSPSGEPELLVKTIESLMDCSLPKARWKPGNIGFDRIIAELQIGRAPGHQENQPG